jgi:diguanylate cyclase (GGDEF)-like protein
MIGGTIMLFLARLLFRDIGKNIGKREVILRIGVSTLSILFAVYHVFFFICFALLYKLYAILPINLICILLYIFVVLMNRHKVSAASGVIFAIIPAIYAIVCVYLIGWELGAQWYLVALITPIHMIYEKFSVMERRLCVLIPIISMALLCYMVMLGQEPVYSGQTFVFMQFANIFLAIVVGMMSAEVLQFSSLFNQRRYQNKIANLTDESNRDPLTKMFNRRYVENVLTNIFWDESTNRERIFIASIDIDHFKNINEEYGHETGDDVLKKFAQVMLKGFRGTDVAARWGGEAFLVILNDTDERGALKALENFKNKLKYAEFFIDDERKIDVTVTMGFVSCNVNDSYAECIMRSDEALSYGKGNGRDLIVNYRDVPGAKSF